MVSGRGMLGRGGSVDTRHLNHVSWRVRVARGTTSVRHVLGSDAIVETVATTVIRHQRTIDATKYHRVVFVLLKTPIIALKSIFHAYL
jgi:hypothetical protein